MRKHGCTPSSCDKHVTLAVISSPSDARGWFVGGHQSGLAGCKSPPLFKRKASSCFVTAAMPAQSMGCLSTTECT